jgi:hypothetical protein
VSSVTSHTDYNIIYGPLYPMGVYAVVMRELVCKRRGLKRRKGFNRVARGSGETPDRVSTIAISRPRTRVGRSVI